MPCYQAYYGLDAPCSDARPELQCPMLETLRTGKSAHVIHEFPKSEQLPAYGNIVTYPVKDPDGQIIRVIEIWRDITEAISNHWEERMKTLKDDLNRMVQEDRMISLGKLVASCVHEINNPLQGLLTYSYIAKDILTQDHLQASDIAELKHFADTMTTELERCGKIVSGLLSFSRETPLAYRLIDIGEVIRSVLSLTRHKIELQEIELETRLLSEMILIKGDPNRLQQCLLNLIFNAIEAMPEGGRLCVAERLKGDPRWYEITIADTGCGIEKDQLNHIFDPFYTTKPEGQGTGLGLSIVYGIVKNHQGKLDVESAKGKGTTFRLQFPVH
jgi:signal transduction histidine kinase